MLAATEKIEQKAVIRGTAFHVVDSDSLAGGLMFRHRMRGARC
jgi:hypothetical protein